MKAVANQHHLKVFGLEVLSSFSQYLLVCGKRTLQIYEVSGAHLYFGTLDVLIPSGIAACPPLTAMEIYFRTENP